MKRKGGRIGSRLSDIYVKKGDIQMREGGSMNTEEAKGRKEKAGSKER